jgi:hypothetical protein
VNKTFKPPRQLINHRDVAVLFGTSARNWVRWVKSGVVPAPHQQIGTMLLYDREVISHRLATGKWPAGTVFSPGRATASGKGRTPPCVAETPSE